MARVYYSNSATARTTTATATFVNKLTLTFTPNASKTYVCFWSALLDNDSGTVDGIVRANILSTNQVQQTFNYEMQDATDVYSSPGMFIYNAPATPTAQTWAIQFASETTSTVGIADAYMAVLELDANDKFMANATLTSRTTASYANVGNTEITCTAGNWLIIASAEVNSNDNTPATTLQYRLYNHTLATEISNTGPSFVKDATNYTPLWLAYTANFAASNTIGLQLRSDGAAAVNIRNTRMLALDLSKFKSWFIKQDLAATTVTATTPTTVEELPLNFLARDDYLELFFTTSRGSSATSSQIIDYFVNFEEGDITLNSEPLFREMNSVNEFYDMGAGVISRLNRRKATFTQKAYVETNGQSNVIKNNVIAILQLGDAPREARRIVLG